MATPALKFILVMAVAQRGFWRVHGLHFSREWRPLQLGDELDLNAAIPVIDDATDEQIEHDVKIGALACKPATSDEVEAYLKQLAESRGQDKDSVIADLKSKNAELEARLMKLELAVSGGGGKDAGGKDAGGKAKGEQQKA